MVARIVICLKKILIFNTKVERNSFKAFVKQWRRETLIAQTKEVLDKCSEMELFTFQMKVDKNADMISVIPVLTEIKLYTLYKWIFFALCFVFRLQRGYCPTLVDFWTYSSLDQDCQQDSGLEKYFKIFCTFFKYK